MLYTADFETTTDQDDCRVWAWGVCEIGNEYKFEYGNDIDGFIEYLKKSKNSTFYFHNLKFDSQFLLCWLFENGYKHVIETKDEDTKTFSTLISDKGQFYSIKIIFEKKGKKTKYVKIYDSLKILPFSVAQVAKGFNLPISKLDLDYTAKREIRHIITDEEREYLKNDVEIMARALKVIFDQGLTKMTQGSNALFDYKRTVGEKKFERCFPVPDYDKDVRQSYKGGYTYLNPMYKGVDVGEGIVLDVNSLYPWVLHDCLLPYGNPIYFEGKYETDNLYPLYVQMITCQFELKPGFLPTIQLKNNLSFIPTQYIETSGDREVTMCLTSVDLELFFEHYEVLNPVYHSGWKFKGTIGLFTEYIDKWMQVKIDSTINGNKAMRTLAKLMLNALYGKFALNPKVRSKIPFYDDGIVKYRDGEWDERNPLYIPVGTFVTAYARRKTISSAQMVYDKFIYADTDSLHLDLHLPPELSKLSNDELEAMTTEDLREYGVEFPEGFVINPVALGAWKVESRFTRARFLRQKSYIEDWNKPETWNTPDYNKALLNITCAGMPEACYPFVNWDNFHEGNTFPGKLLPKRVKGGIVLQETEYTIQKSY